MDGQHPNSKNAPWGALPHGTFFWLLCCWLQGELRDDGIFLKAALQTHGKSCLLGWLFLGVLFKPLRVFSWTQRRKNHANNPTPSRSQITYSSSKSCRETWWTFPTTSCVETNCSIPILNEWRY
jgi:hypothetical protein